MEAGCPAAKVRTTREVLQMPKVMERGMLLQSSVGEDRPVTLINAGFTAEEGAPGLSRPVPQLGADTEAVLRDLGYEAGQLAQLREAGVI